MEKDFVIKLRTTTGPKIHPQVELGLCLLRISQIACLYPDERRIVTITRDSIFVSPEYWKMVEDLFLGLNEDCSLLAVQVERRRCARIVREHGVNDYNRGSIYSLPREIIALEIEKGE